MTRNIPRPEYPRPQFQREEWENLNGSWSYHIDYGRSGREQGFILSKGFDNEINIPFCPESLLSGINHKDFIECLWYHRSIEISPAWKGKQILLHFGAVDYETHVYLDGFLVGIHYGGSASFTCNISSVATIGVLHNLIVHVKDDLRTGNQPAGKQSLDYFSGGCNYSRVSGIWQTVWLEAIDPCALLRCDFLCDIDNKLLNLIPHFPLSTTNKRLRTKVYFENEEISEKEYLINPSMNISFDLSSKLKLWSPETPSLYDIKFEVIDKDNKIIDEVRSYAGMRKISVEGNRIFLNNTPIYLRFILDQGYYPNGIWTAPDDEALRNDILLGKNAGFNGARLHQKVFEERFHYWADRLGYLTWAEFPNWGLSMKSDTAARNFLSEWRDVVIRDKNHPSIIAWTPLNETWDITDQARHRRFHTEVYNLTKTIDPSRPVNGASGGCQVITDIYAVHNYEQDPAKLYEMLTPQPDGSLYATLGDKEEIYKGQPYVVDEFGGIKWIGSTQTDRIPGAWGYGKPPQTLEEFYERLEEQVNALLSLEHISGFCYTQLTDVEQEQNGIYNYNRSQKFDISIIKRIFSK